MPSWKKVIVSGSDASLNSLIVPSITGSLQGTASFAITASYVATSSYSVYADYVTYSTSSSDILIYVKNTTGTQIDKGKVVRITGATGDTALIATASYESDTVSANTLGITNENIANDAFGYVITEGRLVGINTNGWAAGQLLFLGANGSITATVPQAPLHAVRLGQVLRVQQNNGSMYVRIDNGYELNELHDVDDNTTTTSYGDLLVKSGSVWINSRQLTGSYALTGSLTITGSSLPLLVRNSDGSSATSISQLYGGSSIRFNFRSDGVLNWGQNATSSNAGILSWDTGKTVVGTGGTNNLSLFTNGNERMTISSSGLIGIGITTPSASLHITNTTTANSFLVEDSTNPDATPFVIDNTGLVGIGYMPSAGRDGILQVSGTINIEPGYAYEQDSQNVIRIERGTDSYYASIIAGATAGTSGSARQTAYGYNAGASISGSFQTAIGYAAGYANSGSYQTTVGYNAGRNNSGLNQTTIGVSAGQYNSGSNQSAFGYQAGYLNTGNNQTTVGYQAGYGNIGTWQVAVGESAGAGNLGGQQSVFGVQAGYQNSGSNQTAIGHQAGWKNSGSIQTAVGYQAGYQNIGSEQVAMGLWSGQYNIGSNQTSVGSYSGQYNIGIYQTAVGYVAGRYNSGSSQTAVGYGSGLSNSGIAQTAVGYLAGQYNYSSNQSAIGSYAGTFNSGSNQTAVGYYAGRLNSGSNQTAVGYGAGYDNTGYAQTAIGVEAGYQNIGDNQTQIGIGAGYLNSGSFQTVVGVAAGERNQTANQTALGSYAGFRNSGSLQTAVGFQAGYRNTETYQTAIGYNAGYFNTGSYQTALGVNAGREQRGSYQTALGIEAGYQNAANEQTAIGHGAGFQNSGSQQVAVGHYAGWQNSASQQTTVGFYSGRLNEGIHQTATGYYAGYLNIGSFQTAIGSQAGYQNTANSQTAVGGYAGVRNVTNAQTAIGYFAGYENSGSSQTAVGYYAGFENSGSNQTAVGVQAGYLNSGSFQTAIGVDAGYLNSGLYQTVTGYQAGQYNINDYQSTYGFRSGFKTTASLQTAIGSFAGREGVSSAQTAVGHAAGEFHAGSNQTAIGAYAGRFTTSSNQTSIGVQAGEYNIGANQTAIGLSAGRYNIGTTQTVVGTFAGISNSGASVTQVGVAAGQYNIGNYQTAIGVQAGYLNTGSAQTSVGYFAGAYNSGSDNTNIGYTAGLYTTGTTINSQSAQSVFLGSTTYAGGANRTNQIVIGYNASGIGSNSVVLGNDSILTTALKGFVGIGTTSPTTSLHINNTSTSASFLVEDNTNPDSTPFIIDATGNVGIGTTSPTAKLTVQVTGSAASALVANFIKSPAVTNETGSTFIRISSSPILITGSGQYTDIEYNAGYGGPFRYGTYADTNIINGNHSTTGNYGSINFVTSGSTRMTVAGGTSAGNVGIGTINPTAKLEVVGSYKFGPVNGVTFGNYEFGTDMDASGFTTPYARAHRIKTPDPDNSVFFGVHGSGSALYKSFWTLDTSGSNSFYLSTKGIHLSSSGNVGIGNTAPAVRLDVVTTESQSLRLSATGTAGLRNTLEFFSPPTDATSATRAGAIYSIYDGVSYTNARLSFQSMTTGNVLVDTMHLKNGNVGIGITVPTARLHINHTGSGNSFLVEDETNPDTSPFVIDTSGSVGIGTTAPSQKLDIVGDGQVITRLRSNATGSAYYLTEVNSNTTAIALGKSGAIIGTGSSNILWSSTDLQFYVNNLERARITSNGNVGIGTTTPSASLHTTGSAIVANSMVIGSSSLGPYENTLTLGARDNVQEGGQLGFNAAGGTYTSASFIDLYQNRLRILKGTNATSTGEVANWNMHNLQMALPAYSSVSSFPGTAVGYLAFDSGGNVITVAAGNAFPYTGSAEITGSISVNNALFTSTTATANIGSTTIYSVSTSSYDGAWFEYTARSGSNARAGQIMAIDSGSAVNFTETTTTDFGSTSGLALGVYIVNGAMALTASAATNGWSIKTIVRSI